MSLKEYKCKLVLLGESGTGKTCIINNVFGREFQEETLTTTTMGGYETTEVIIGERKIKVAIWDTNGQERFRAVAKSFYRNADIVVFVYDITKQNSFDSIQSYWYKEVMQYSKDLKGIF